MKKKRHHQGNMGRCEPRTSTAEAVTTVLTPPSGTNMTHGEDMKKGRLMTALFWDIALKCPPQEEWDGKFGSIATIMRSLRLKGSKARKI